MFWSLFFIFFSLLESPVPGVSDTVKSQLQPRVAKLKKHDSMGVQVVLKLLANWRRTLDMCHIPGAFYERPLPPPICHLLSGIPYPPIPIAYLPFPIFHFPSVNPPFSPWNQGWVMWRNGCGSAIAGVMWTIPCDRHKVLKFAQNKIAEQIQNQRNIC